MLFQEIYMKKIIFLLLAVFSSLSLEAHNLPGIPNSLSGKVINNVNRQPLPGATVYIPDLKRGAVADQNGHYEINNLPSGKYLVEVRYAGFSTLTHYILIGEQTVKNWTLSPAIIEGREVVITGVSKATELHRQPTHISVLNHLELQETTTDNIIGKIADLPGVNAVTTGPNVMKPMIRGLYGSRVVVVNNGIRQEGQQWGAEHGIEIDAYAAGTIEIMRGASSLMYGSDALGGVVNILPPDPAPEGHIQGEVIGNYQTNNGLYAAHAAMRGNNNGLTWHAYGTLKQAHDYKDKYDGYVFNTKFKERNFGAGIGLNKAWGYSHLYFSSYDLNLGLPEGERDETSGKFLKEVVLPNGTAGEKIAAEEDFKSYNPYIGKQRVQHQKVTLDNKLLLEKGSLDATLALQQNRRREYADVLHPGNPEMYLRLNTFNFNVHYTLNSNNGWNITAGTSGMLQGNKNKGEEFLIPDFKLFDAGVYGIAQKTLDRFTFSGGVRGDFRKVQAEAYKEEGKLHFPAFNRDFAAFSGSLGLSFSLSRQLVLKANVARGFRAPALLELSANGVHEGTLRYEIGNVHLKPETSLEFDAGASFESPHISASLYGYLNNINQFIYSRKLLTVSGADSIRHYGGGDYKVFQYEQTDGRLYGVEASVDIHPHPLDWLHFKNTFSYVRGVRVNATDSTKNLPKIPAARWMSELGFHFSRSGHMLQKLFLNLKLNNTFAQTHFMSAYRTETATPAYSLLDIEAGTNVANKAGRVLFKLLLSADNITNVAYQDHLSRLKYLPVNEATGRQGIFNMGRNFSFKVIVPFDFVF